MKINSTPALTIIVFLLSATTYAQRNYFISAAGNDHNDGRTLSSAWKTLEKINQNDYKPGDTIYLNGGDSFTGTLQLTSDDNGSLAMPVVIASLGQKKATIVAGPAGGVLAINCSNIRINGIEIKGNGVENNDASGIHFYSNDSIQAPSNIRITNCDISGFRNAGIMFGANESLNVKGYHNVHITHCNVTENGNAGISSYGSQLAFQHSDFYIAYCRAYRNAGIRSKKQGHSGNGIVMAQVNEILIEHCEAFENGRDNQSTEGGPVGIWVWMCKSAVIQHCVSHHNYAGYTKDGGGFDIDGGSSDCIIQNNYSYSNEGAGYLLAEFGARFPFKNNIIRFNVSINDGRKNGYGSITIWGADPDYSVTNSIVHNNTIYLDDQGIVDGMPVAVNFMGNNFSNVLVANNIFITKGAVKFITSDTSFDASAARLLNNNYYSLNGHNKFQWNNKKYNSLQSWLNSDVQQERINQTIMAMSLNPLFINNKSIQNLASMDLQDLPNDIFALQKNSPLRNKKFKPGYMNFNYPGLKDYCNKILTNDRLVIPGACID